MAWVVEFILLYVDPTLKRALGNLVNRRSGRSMCRHTALKVGSALMDVEQHGRGSVCHHENDSPDSSSKCGVLFLPAKNCAGDDGNCGMISLDSYTDPVHSMTDSIPYGTRWF